MVGSSLDQATEGYRAPQVCNLVGITYRQLDYWARTGLITPSLQQATGSGSQRLYTFQDVVQLKVVKRLLDAGMSLKKIRLGYPIRPSADLWMFAPPRGFSQLTTAFLSRKLLGIPRRLLFA